MEIAIDNYSVGRQREASANEFKGQSINVLQRRFVCSECGELVGLDKRGHFYHANKTIGSPDCDKRADATSIQNMYERMGLPLYIKIDKHSEFKLYMGFYPLNESILQNSQENHLFIIIRNPSTSEEIKFGIDPYTFSSEYITLHEIPFVPNDGSEYSIEYSHINQSIGIKKRWTTYADGFTTAGALFNYSELGGRKIRKGSSIAADESYLLVWYTPRLPQYNGFINEYIGELRMDLNNYHVFKVCFSSKVSEKDFIKLSNFCRESFKVSLLYKEPKIFPLWPPCVQQDNAYTTYNHSKKLICEIISGNQTPTIYQYNENNSLPSIYKTLSSNNTLVDLNLGQNTSLICIDQRSTGNITFISNNLVDIQGFIPEINIIDETGAIISSEINCKLPYNRKVNIFSNVKATLYHKKVGQIITAYKLRNGEECILKDIAFGDILLLYIGGRQIDYWKFEKSIRTIEGISDQEVYAMLVKGSLPYTNTPLFIKKLIRYYNDFPKTKHLLKKYVIQGVMPVGSLKILKNLNRKGNGK